MVRKSSLGVKAGLWVGTSAASVFAVAVMAGGCGGRGGGGNGGGDFLATGRTLSYFQAVQVDPQAEDSAGPQFVAAEDLNGDGYVDLVSAWNQSQPVQIHLQRRSDTGRILFETLTLAGNVPVLSVSGLALGDLDGDGNNDIVVLVKHSALEGPGCLDGEVPSQGLAGVILTYLGPANPAQANQALAWEEVQVGGSFLQGAAADGDTPEEGGFTGMAVGDVDADGLPDIVAAWNSNCGGGSTAALLFTNLGAGAVRDGRWAVETVPDTFIKGTAIKDVALGDIDGDSDLDVVATLPDAPAMNVRWYRNPTIDVPDDYHISDGQWQVGVVGQIATGADVIRLGDIDGDTLVDVVVRSTDGALIQWLKGPAGPTTAPLRAIPWQVYTLAEFLERIPESFALGDLDFDGRPELVAAAEGGIILLDSGSSPSVYDQWIESLIVDDLAPGSPAQAPATTDPNVEPEEVAGSTFINSILIADVDGDGSSDLLATLDRSGLSGLSNDALAWFRNTRRAP